MTTDLKDKNIQAPGAARPEITVRRPQSSSSVRPSQSSASVRSSQAGSQTGATARPAQATGQVKRTQPSGSVRPAQAGAQARPSQVSGATRSSQTGGQASTSARPVQSSSQASAARPAQATGQVKRTQPSGSVRPAQAGAQTRPSQASGATRSSQTGGQASTSARPVQSSSQASAARPAQATGQVKRSQPSGQVRPGQAGAQTIPSQASGAARPAQSAGQVKRIQPGAPAGPVQAGSPRGPKPSRDARRVKSPAAKKGQEVSVKSDKLTVGKVVGRIFAVIGITLLILVAGIYAIMYICTHGPSPVARDLFVLSVRESSAGGFLADMVCTKEEIAEIVKNNQVKEVDEVTDATLIHFAEKDPENPEKEPEPIEVPGREPYLTKEGILFYEVKGPTYTGSMIVVKDPSRVFVGTSKDKYDGSAGINVPAITKKYGATLGVNAGGFVDTNGAGNGGTPLGIVMSQGKLLYGSKSESYNLIGFNKDNVFVIGSMTGQQALDRGIRDAVSFGPFLIMNGKALQITGTGGGLNPRTAIGQRADGAVLILIIDGRQTHSLGASMNDLINVMLDFGAVNAANLDGGGSTVLYYDGEVQNKIASIYGARGVPNAILVK